jgi:YVTN family beta-propeller protein
VGVLSFEFSKIRPAAALPIQFQSNPAVQSYNVGIVPDRFSRRVLLVSSAALLACSRRKATRYPGYCFVANHDARSIALVDLSTFRLLRPIRLDAAPSAVLSHPRLPRVLALAPSPATVYEIDAASFAVTRQIRVGGQAAGMLLAGSDVLWVLCREPAALVEIPLDSFRPRRRIPLPDPPDDFDISGQRAAVVSRSGGTVVLASLEHGAVVRTVPVTRDSSIVRFQQKGAQVIAGSPSDHSVSMLDAATGALLVRLPIPVEPRHFCFSADEGQLFISGPGKDAVVIVYPYQTEIGETILAGRAPAAMAVAGANGANYLLVTNPETNTVTALDVDTRRLAAVVNVGREPRHILVTPDRQYALVLNEGSGDLAVIRIASLAARRYKSAPLFTLIPVGEKPVDAAVITFT